MSDAVALPLPPIRVRRQTPSGTVAMVLGVSQSIGFRINPGFGILAGHLVFLMALAVRPQGLLGRQ